MIGHFARLLALQCPLLLKPGKVNLHANVCVVSFILVQKPAPVSDINVTPSATSTQVTLENPRPETSSYIQYYDIYLNHQYKMMVARQNYRTTFSIRGLKPNTKYNVRIWARDGSFQWSSAKSEEFMTSDAGR